MDQRSWRTALYVRGWKARRGTRPDRRSGSSVEEATETAARSKWKRCPWVPALGHLACLDSPCRTGLPEGVDLDHKGCRAVRDPLGRHGARGAAPGQAHLHPLPTPLASGRAARRATGTTARHRRSPEGRGWAGRPCGHHSCGPIFRSRSHPGAHMGAVSGGPSGGHGGAAPRVARRRAAAGRTPASGDEEGRDPMRSPA